MGVTLRVRGAQFVGGYIRSLIDAGNMVAHTDRHDDTQTESYRGSVCGVNIGLLMEAGTTVPHTNRHRVRRA